MAEFRAENCGIPSSMVAIGQLLGVLSPLDLDLVASELSSIELPAVSFQTFQSG